MEDVGKMTINKRRKWWNKIKRTEHEEEKEDDKGKDTIGSQKTIKYGA